MAFYGQSLNSGYDPAKDYIYPLFTTYFENPKMIKVKNIDTYSMYITKIHAILGIEFRYLIVFIPSNNLPKGDEKFLGELEWVSLQTRTLTDDHNLSYHSYTPKRLKNLDKKIHLEHSDDKQYIYSVDEFPLKVILLPRTKGINYNSNGTIVSALETYQTLVTFLN
jgi:hypothetical protein